MKCTLLSVAALASCLAMKPPHNRQPSPPLLPAQPHFPPDQQRSPLSAFRKLSQEPTTSSAASPTCRKNTSPSVSRLKTLNDESTSLQKELQTQAATLSDADRAIKAKSLDDKQKELKRAGEDAQTDYQQDMQQTFAAVAGKFAETLDAYAKEHGFSVVLDGGNQQLPVVIYANPTIDITKAVVDAYNVKSGIPAPETQRLPPPPPGTAAPAKAVPKAPAAH